MRYLSLTYGITRMRWKHDFVQSFTRQKWFKNVGGLSDLFANSDRCTPRMGRWWCYDYARSLEWFQNVSSRLFLERKRECGYAPEESNVTVSFLIFFFLLVFFMLMYFLFSLVLISFSLRFRLVFLFCILSLSFWFFLSWYIPLSSSAHSVPNHPPIQRPTHPPTQSVLLSRGPVENLTQDRLQKSWQRLTTPDSYTLANHN